MSNGENLPINSKRMKNLSMREEEFTKSRRFTLPIKHKNIWDICSKMNKNTWFVDSMDFSKCSENFKKLDLIQQTIVKNSLIAATVLEDYIKKKLSHAMDKLKLNEIRHYLTYCQAQEETHSISYEKLLYMYCGGDISENIPKWLVSIEGKVSSYLNDCKSISEMMLGFACLEGILFHETFIIPYALKCENLLPEFIALNSEISRDENLHAEFWCMCLDMACLMTDKEMIATVEKFYDIGVELAIRISKSKDLLLECKIQNEDVDEFNSLTSSNLKDSLNVIDFKDMKSHLLLLKNKLLKRLGLEYETTDKPLEVMELTGSISRTNFFENIPTEYNRISTNNPKLIKDF